MNKNILQDIKPLTSTGKRGVITEFKNKEEYVPPKVSVDSSRSQYRQEEVVRPVRTNDFNEEGHKSKKGIWVVTIAALVGLFIAVSFVFKGATITVTPKSQHISVDDAFTAKSGGSDTDLTFDVVEIKEEISTDINTTETKEVSRKATGKVTLFNKSSSAQALKIETRLETKDGKIFKTDKAITVPAAKTISGKSTPGQIEVSVTADIAGEEYNIGPSDFVIFGFKGTSKAGLFSGQSKQSMTGGFKGMEANIAEEDRVKIKAQLTEQLKSSLMTKAIAQVPAEFIYYDDGVFFTPSDSLLVSKVDGKVKATLQGTLLVVLFNEGKFSRYLAKEFVTDYDNSDITLQGIKAMQFSIKNKDQINPKEAKDISFSLSGEADVVWSVDVDALRDALVGKKKKEFSSVLSTMPAIESAEVSLNPIWMSTFPTDKKDISVKLNTIGNVTPN